jgi:plasmid stability protein
MGGENVPQITIRNLDAATVTGLKRRARQRGRTLDSELKDILENASRFDMERARRLAASIRRSLKGRKFEDSAAIIREARDGR